MCEERWKLIYLALKPSKPQSVGFSFHFYCDSQPQQHIMIICNFKSFPGSSLVCLGLIITCLIQPNIMFLNVNRLGRAQLWILEIGFKCGKQNITISKASEFWKNQMGLGYEGKQ